MEENKETTQETIEDFNIWDSPSSFEPQIQENPVEQNTEVVAETIQEEIPETTNVTDPVIQEKIVEVEKIVEKPLEFKDDYSKSLYEAISQGNEEAAYNYLQEKFRDYNSMSDIDVIKTKLQRDNPTWTQRDIDVEIRSKYGKNFDLKDLSEIDPDINPREYEEAVRFNEDIEKRETLLQRDARDSRVFLNESKKSIELPQIKSEPVAEPVKQFTEEEIIALNKAWEQRVESELPKLSDLSFKVGDEEVKYLATNEEKAELIAKMKGFNDVEYLTSRGWYDEKGNINILKVAEDVRKLENFDKVVSSISTQLKTSATKEVKASIKNVNLTNNNVNTTDFTEELNLWK